MRWQELLVASSPSKTKGKSRDEILLLRGEDAKRSVRRMIFGN